MTLIGQIRRCLQQPSAGDSDAPRSLPPLRFESLSLNWFCVLRWRRRRQLLLHAEEAVAPSQPAAGEDIGQPPSDRDVLEQIAREMRAAESLLREKKSASETQQLQQNIVAELDKLIDQSKQSGSGGAAKSQAQRSAMKKQQAAAAPKPKPGATARAGEGQNRQESQEDARRPQDVLAEVWGQLPEQLQKQIQSPVREQFLPQYEQLIIEYYKRLAEENRK